MTDGRTPICNLRYTLMSCAEAKTDKCDCCNLLLDPDEAVCEFDRGCVPWEHGRVCLCEVCMQMHERVIDALLDRKRRGIPSINYVRFSEPSATENRSIWRVNWGVDTIDVSPGAINVMYDESAQIDWSLIH